MNSITYLLVLVAIISIARPSSAQEESRALGLHAIGGKLGLVNPKNLDGTIGFGVQADLGDIRPNIALIPSVRFWSTSIDFSFLGSIDISELSLNADLYYFLSLESALQPYGGAGVGLTLTEVSVSGTTFSDDGIGWGLNLFGGVKYPVATQLDIMGEARFKFGSSSYDLFSIMVGVLYRLSQ